MAANPAAVAYEAYRNALKKDIPDWNDLSKEEKIAWWKVVSSLLTYWNSNDN